MSSFNNYVITSTIIEGLSGAFHNLPCKAEALHQRIADNSDQHSVVCVYDVPG